MGRHCSTKRISKGLEMKMRFLLCFIYFALCPTSYSLNAIEDCTDNPRRNVLVPLVSDDDLLSYISKRASSNIDEESKQLNRARKGIAFAIGGLSTTWLTFLNHELISNTIKIGSWSWIGAPTSQVPIATIVTDNIFQSLDFHFQRTMTRKGFLKKELLCDYLCKAFKIGLSTSCGLVVSPISWQYCDQYFRGIGLNRFIIILPTLIGQTHLGATGVKSFLDFSFNKLARSLSSQDDDFRMRDQVVSKLSQIIYRLEKRDEDSQRIVQAILDCNAIPELESEENNRVTRTVIGKRISGFLGSMFGMVAAYGSGCIADVSMKYVLSTYTGLDQATIDSLSSAGFYISFATLAAVRGLYNKGTFEYLYDYVGKYFGGETRIPTSRRLIDAGAVILSVIGVAGRIQLVLDSNISNEALRNIVISCTAISEMGWDFLGWKNLISFLNKKDDNRTRVTSLLNKIRNSVYNLNKSTVERLYDKLFAEI